MTVQYERSDAFVYRHVAGEHLLLALKRDRTAPMFMLTPTGGFLWERLAAWTSAADLVAQLVERFEVSADVAARDVEDFLQQLRQLGAVSVRGGDA